jgi:UDP-N-acetylglucosamine 4,6-dehydratase/5-epimerase
VLNETSILVTGGTGSFGKAFIRTVLERYPGVQRLVVYSRDEMKQWEMAQMLPETRHPQMRYFIGDVRDRDRLSRAMEGIDVVIHAAALKQVPVCEYNPIEAIKTNVVGAQNVIETAIDAGVKRVMALSTDKAAAPINLYGATKLCSDKLFVAANSFRGSHDIRFGVVRYGNVLGSRGSVIPYFLAKRAEGVLPITDERMTRFNITLEHGVQLVLDALEMMWGGEIFVPKIPSYRITDLAEAIGPGCEKVVVGIRPGEKLHEDLITEADAANVLELADKFVILPSINVTPEAETLRTWDIAAYADAVKGTPVPPGFRYTSGTNTEWLGVDELRDLIRAHVDPSFTV